MLNTRSKTGTRLILLVAAVGVCLTTGTRPAADDEPAPVLAKEPAKPVVSDNVTRSITIHAPSVTVRANPTAAPDQPQAHQGGQYAYIDEQGNLLDAPPPGRTVSVLPLMAPSSRGSFRSSVDPNAVLRDARHIRAVMSARVGADGTIEKICVNHKESLDHVCSEAAESSPAATAEAPANAPTKEEQE